MSGDWMKIELSTPEKPEIYRIGMSLDIDTDSVLGKLVRFWCWFNAHSIDGKEPADAVFFLDKMVGCNGFCDALIEVGWLETDGEYIQVEKFDRHNGDGAKKRATTNRRVARHRHKGKQKADSNGNETVVALQKRIPEKRIEEKNTPERKVVGVGGDTLEIDVEVKK